jgi:hypothetical protein
MMLSLAALLADPRLELRLLVPGPDGALRAEAVWVHNTELPDPSPYVREGELVLTNGLWLETTEPAEFVANVLRARATGIVFGLRAERDRTPAGLVDACRSADLPLAEIAVEVPFTAVTRAAAALYAQRRQDALLGMLQRGDALATAITRGAGASGILEVLRDDHDLPLAVIDRRGRLLATAGPGLDADDRSAVAAALARRPPPLEVDLAATGRAALFLVGGVGGTDAALLCLRPLSALRHVEQDALVQAARYLSLEVAQQQAVQAVEMRFASELLDMILSGPQRAAELPARLRAFGVDPDGPLAVCALAFALESPAAPDPGPTLPGMAEVVTEFFLADGLPAVVAGGSQDVVAVLPWRRSVAELTGLAVRLAGALAEGFGGRRAVVGLSEPARGSNELRQPLVRSREACRVLRHRRGRTDVATFAELGTYRILLEAHDDDRLRGFADTVLGPLRAHDRARGGELEATLRAFLDHDGQWSATAAALFVHVNTLRNRLTRITELTGRDVGRTADRVDLFLALEVGDPQSG